MGSISDEKYDYDVIVVGSGNAGFSAAAAAKEHDPNLRVLLLEKAPEEWAGGNSTFTAGAYRTVFHGLDDVLPLVNNAPPDVASRIDMSPYMEEDFMHDLQRVTNGKTDPELSKVLVRESRATTKWLAKNGIQFQFSFNRQAYEIDGRFKFWGGMVLMVEDGGKGLTRMHQANARRKGVEVLYECPVVGLVRDEPTGPVVGVEVRMRGSDRTKTIRSRGGVILSAGGFEADSDMREKHLGPGWSKAYVRGTPHNTGDLLKLAMKAGAATVGFDPVSAGCHATCWDANASNTTGDRVLSNQYTKSGYPLGLMLNTQGKRFVNEGIDMRNYTYAVFGKAILRQPSGVVFQVWDADGTSWLRKEEYAPDVVQRITTESLQELAKKLAEQGLQAPDDFVRTIEEYNAAVAEHRKENPDVKFDPSKKDGLSTRSSGGGLELDKTNWALPIAKPPFLAVKVACGVTFTFGGLRADPNTAAVLADEQDGSRWRPIEGLFVAGEMLGGLFNENYPGGSGLTAGAVFGRKAGTAAAKRALEKS
ncbi:Fumarate flavoprotein subunit [Cyphellophora attinorum]|uniref:Fumarate flavoprotein subunit n=1 Tax=Cyphellophora attinorum TaxID=1664694 RepID=A0A0N0NHA5_9EURO|nr:Fumarate flavoprotein subunit [Phialophora attinorum]KPI34461.1 Fumarate flavoprotein subunit [Phialophora attinorum]